MLLGVDVGGTFTDAVLAFDGAVVTAKAPTTPEDQSEGVIAAVEAALAKAGRQASEVETFSHGMTVATNALLEGHGARTALLATEGFTDLIALGRQTRAELYRLCARAPRAAGRRRAALRRPRADDARTGRSRELGRAGCRGWRSGSPRPSPRRSRSCCCTPTATPTHERALGEALAERFPTRTCRCRTRWSARSASTSARPPPRSTRRSRRCWPATCARLRRAAPRGAAARARDHAVQRRPDRPRGGRRPRRLDGALGPRRAAPPAPRSWPAPPARRTPCASTWAAPPATCA